ncbi:MAG: class I SAM-dependent methyltransferase [Gemmatimonadota bacterium]|nr:class I SAM-dependent methyltransferase [Gemmatimonadota bacterium]
MPNPRRPLTVKSYDKRYFDRFYRDPKRRVIGSAELSRKAAMVVGIAEYVLDRRIRLVLDVGCGEGAWRAPLLRLRPGLRYRGIDSSAYAVERFGKRRGIAPGTFADLERMSGVEEADVVVCSDLLHYLEASELQRGLIALSWRLRGIAYLHAFTSADEISGDTRGWKRRSPTYYRRLFADAGLVACAPHCYVAGDAAVGLAALERALLRPDGGRRPGPRT